MDVEIKRTFLFGGDTSPRQYFTHLSARLLDVYISNFQKRLDFHRPYHAYQCTSISTTPANSRIIGAGGFYTSLRYVYGLHIRDSDPSLSCFHHHCSFPAPTSLYRYATQQYALQSTLLTILGLLTPLGEIWDRRFKMLSDITTYSIFSTESKAEGHRTRRRCLCE